VSNPLFFVVAAPKRILGTPPFLKVEHYDSCFCPGNSSKLHGLGMLHFTIAEHYDAFLPSKLSAAAWDMDGVRFPKNDFCIESSRISTIGSFGAKPIDIDQYSLHGKGCCERLYVFCKVLPDHLSFYEVPVSVESYALINRRPLDRCISFFSEWSLAAINESIWFIFSSLTPFGACACYPAHWFHDWWDKRTWSRS
jgi:hypothetical protein